MTHTPKHEATDAMGMSNANAQNPLSGKSGEAMSPISKDAPVMAAWEAYKAGDSYQNTRRWASHEEHVDGSLWAAFSAGFTASRATTQPAEQRCPADHRQYASMGHGACPYCRASLEGIRGEFLRPAAEQSASSHVEGEAFEFPYQRTFNAIADAVARYPGSIGISVEKFQRSFNASGPAPTTRSVAVSSEAVEVEVLAQTAWEARRNYISVDVGEEDDTGPWPPTAGAFGWREDDAEHACAVQRAEAQAIAALLNQARKPEGAGALPASPSGGQGSSAAPIPTESLEPLLANLEHLHDKMLRANAAYEASPTGEGCLFRAANNTYSEFVREVRKAFPHLIAAVRAREVGMEPKAECAQPSRSDILERIRAFDFEARYGEPEYERLADDLEALAQPNQPRDREEG